MKYYKIAKDEKTIKIEGNIKNKDLFNNSLKELEESLEGIGIRDYKEDDEWYPATKELIDNYFSDLKDQYELNNLKYNVNVSTPFGQITTLIDESENEILGISIDEYKDGLFGNISLRKDGTISYKKQNYSGYLIFMIKGNMNEENSFKILKYQQKDKIPETIIDNDNDPIILYSENPTDYYNDKETRMIISDEVIEKQEHKNLSKERAINIINKTVYYGSYSFDSFYFKEECIDSFHKMFDPILNKKSKREKAKEKVIGMFKKNNKNN